MLGHLDGARRLHHSIGALIAVQMRVARIGPKIAYSAAEADEPDFRLLQVFPGENDDLVDFRLIGTTGDVADNLDVRLSDFVVRAASIQETRTVEIIKQIEYASGDAKAVGASPLAPARRWLIGAFVALLLILALGTLLFNRRRGAQADHRPPQ
jgi:hypothetical protein